MQSEPAPVSVASWFAHSIVADDVHAWEPLPESIRDEIAAEMVRDQVALGWPDLQSAQDSLDEWKWA